MSVPARDDEEPPTADADLGGGVDSDAVIDLRSLLDQLVHELFTVGLGVAGALREVEGPVAERLTVVLEDADRLIRTVHSAAVTLRPPPPPEASDADGPAARTAED